MSSSSSPAHPIETLLKDLPLTAVADNKGVLEFEGLPAAVTVLGADPPSLMWQFRINPDGQETEPLLDLFADIPNEFARVSIERGFAWVSLYNLTGVDSEAHQTLLKEVAGAINATDLALSPGCLKCGDLDNARLAYVEGRPTRICNSCVENAFAEKTERDLQLSQGTVSSTLNLPGTVLAAAAVWAILWSLIDVLLGWFRIQVVEINEFTSILLLAMVGLPGYGLGRPLGLVLRRSLVVSGAPALMTALLVSLVVVLGEIGYVAAYVFRVAGIFDLNVTMQIVWDFVSGYTGFWIGCKLVTAASIACFCFLAASDRETSSLDV